MSTRQPRSYRMPPQLLARLDERAKANRTTATALVERMVDEGLRQEDHPGIVFVDEPAGRRARVAGTGLDVWEVISTVQDNAGSTTDAAEYLAIPERFVLAAMRYYADFMYEIDDWIAQNDRLYEVEAARRRRVADAIG